MSYEVLSTKVCVCDEVDDIGREEGRARERGKKEQVHNERTRTLLVSKLAVAVTSRASSPLFCRKCGEERERGKEKEKNVVLHLICCTM